MTTQSVFELDTRIARDSIWLKDLTLSQLRLQRDARFFWLVLIPRRANAVEWFELSEADQSLLHQEVMQSAMRLKDASKAHKINIGALGNVVRQLHVHVIARYDDDVCWPGPVWGSANIPASENLLLDRKRKLGL